MIIPRQTSFMFTFHFEEVKLEKAEEIKKREPFSPDYDDDSEEPEK